MATTLNIANASVTEGSSGGATNLVFRVTRSGDVANETSSVSYAVTAGGAVAADFASGTLPSGTISFAVGETEKLVTVQVLGDVIDENDETFTITLSGASAGTTINTGTATGTIVDDDTAGSVSIGNVTVVESNGSTSAVLTITRTGGSAPFSVDYATGGGTATAGTDYTTTSGTVSFAAGENSKTISIPILGDAVQESQETFNVTLSNAQGGATIGGATGVVTINDDDVTFGFAAPSVTIAEGSSNASPTPTNIQFTVNRTGSTDAAATLTYTITNGATGLTATDSADFAGTMTGTVNFAAGAASATVSIPITADFVAETNEGFTVTLSNPSIGTIVTANASATGQITNDDTAGNVAFGASYTVTEGSSGTTTVQVAIVRTGGTGAPLSVTVQSQDNSALAGSDYTAVNQTVSFAANQSTAYVTVTINPDFAVEGSENFFLSLANPTSGAVVGGSTTVTINDDDSVGSILIGGTSVNEADGTATFTITRTSGTSPFTVNYATSDGTATAGSDYSSTSGTLTFTGGQTTATVTVPIINDTIVEQGETFTMSISGITSGGTVSIAQATITIADNDGANSGGGGTSPIISGSEVYVSASYVLPADSTATLLSTRVNSGTDAIDLTGNANVQNVIGNFGANVLNGGGGADTLQGLAGNDTYIVNASNAAVVESGGNGTDTVRTSVDYVLGTTADVEALQVADATTTANINLTGSLTSQAITGNAGNNIINGFGGSDTMTGLGGDDTYLVRGSGDVVIEANAGGSDTVFTTVSYNLGANEVERLSTVVQADTTDINLIGNFATQAVIGNYGSNVLNGGSGGLDTLIGLRGNDIYAVGDSRTVIFEADGEGSDTVVTSVDYALGAGVSVEVLAAQNRSGSEALTLRGNAFAQTVVGNEGANTINGGGGSDTLVGGGGADRFAFTTALGAGNVDSIVDFQAGTDRIGLASDIFGAVGASLSAAAFTTGSAATTADQRIIFNQTSGQLFYDADGSGSAAAVLFAQLQPGTVLTAASFEVIAPVALIG